MLAGRMAPAAPVATPCPPPTMSRPSPLVGRNQWKRSDILLPFGCFGCRAESYRSKSIIPIVLVYRAAAFTQAGGGAYRPGHEGIGDTPADPAETGRARRRPQAAFGLSRRPGIARDGPQADPAPGLRLRRRRRRRGTFDGG